LSISELKNIDVKVVQKGLKDGPKLNTRFPESENRKATRTCVRKYHLLSWEAQFLASHTNIFGSASKYWYWKNTWFAIPEVKSQKSPFWSVFGQIWLSGELPATTSARLQNIDTTTNPRTVIVWNTDNYQENKSRWGSHLRSDCFGSVFGTYFGSLPKIRQIWLTRQRGKRAFAKYGLKSESQIRIFFQKPQALVRLPCANNHRNSYPPKMPSPVGV